MRKRVIHSFIAIFLALSILGCYCIYKLGFDTSEASMFKPEPINVLVMVKDRFSNSTDSMILINYNPDATRISMLTFPRDTAVDIDGDSDYEKLNSVYTSAGGQDDGAKALCKKVNELTNINVDKYIVADLDIVRDIVDVLGGVDYKVPIRMKYRDKSQNLYIDLHAGFQHLNGEQVEHLLRYRKPNIRAKVPKNYSKYYDGSDLNRTNIQMDFIKEFILQKSTIASVGKINEVLDKIYKNIFTNLSKEEILKVLSKVSTLSEAQYKTFRLYGSGYSYYVYDNRIINTKTNKLLKANNVINKYFIID